MVVAIKLAAVTENSITPTIGSNVPLLNRLLRAPSAAPKEKVAMLISAPALPASFLKFARCSPLSVELNKPVEPITRAKSGVNTKTFGEPKNTVMLSALIAQS